jgi:hypothetical protein
VCTSKRRPQTIWDAIAKPEWTEKYGYAPLIEYELRAGANPEPIQTREWKALGMQARGGVAELTVTRDVTGAPKLTAMFAREDESAGAGGGWSEVLSGLKTLLETGVQLPFQSGPQKE